MALFEQKTKKAAPVVKEQTEQTQSTSRDLANIIVRPRITEKASMHSGAGVYTFNVKPGTNKREVMEAVRALYKVTPRKVSIVTIPTKTKYSPRTGKSRTSGGGKKAYVYLKEGETLQIN